MTAKDDEKTLYSSSLPTKLALCLVHCIFCEASEGSQPILFVFAFIILQDTFRSICRLGKMPT
ncbi:hypothetical protein YC2023_107250 [Brassica napus]